MTYADMYNLPVKIVRPFNVYGPGMRLDDGRGAINFVISALKGERIPIFGDGRNTRTWTYVSDAITGFFQVLLSNHNREVFNVGSDEQEIEMRHFAQLVAGLVRKENVEINYVIGPNEAYSKSADVSRRCPDLTKIRTTLGYVPRVYLVNGLKRFIEWAEDAIKDTNSKDSTAGICNLCHKNCSSVFLNLGKQPLANKYPKKEEIEKEKFFPLEIFFCTNCKNVQLGYMAPRSLMFEDYYYLSSVNLGLVRHFEQLANKLSKSKFVVDIGSNDGILLKPLKERGINCVGVDPSVNVGKIANDKGLTTIISFFDKETVEKIRNNYGKPDAIVASSIFTHVENPHQFIEDIKELMAPDGKFILEVEYIGNILKTIQFERFYLDRIFYYSVTSIKDLFEQHGMNVVDVEEIEPHGGSLRFTIYNKAYNSSSTENVKLFIEKEERELNPIKLNEFKRYVDENINNLREKLLEYKRLGLKVAGYGSPARVSTICNYGKIDQSLIEYIVDDSPLKQNRFTPGTHIPIVSNEYIETHRPDIFVIFAYEYFDDIKRKLNRNYRFLLPIPPKEIL